MDRCGASLSSYFRILTPARGYVAVIAAFPRLAHAPEKQFFSRWQRTKSDFLPFRVLNVHPPSRRRL
jgi:hypothetical protein